MPSRLVCSCSYTIKDYDVLNTYVGISIIPESLIAVLTITMAIGMKHMVSKKVIVRKLDALEALGGVTNICSDKTGTLTQGKMITRKAWIPGIGIYSVNRTQDAADPTSGWVQFGPASSTLPDPEKAYEDEREECDQVRPALTFEDNSRSKMEKDDVFEEDNEIDEAMPEDYTMPEMVEELEAFLHSVALCNLATVRFDKQKAAWQATGDPTEVITPAYSGPSAVLILSSLRLLSKFLPIASIMGRRSLFQMGGTNSENIPSTATSNECQLCSKSLTLGIM